MKKDNNLYKEWIFKAQNDLETAEILFREDGPADSICFHCQQTVEKYLKAFLVFHDVHFEKIHDLWKIAKLCSVKDKNILKFRDGLKILNAYYIATRYPADVISYTNNECKEALNYAKEIGQYIANQII